MLEQGQRVLGCRYGRRRGLQEVYREGYGFGLVLRAVTISVALRIPDPGYSIPQRRKLGPGPGLPSVTQLVRQRVPQLRLARHVARVECQRVAGSDVFA